MTFPTLSPELRAARLAPPAGPVSLVLDTDTYNEIDDQFALVYSLLSPEKLTVEAVHAAPFHNRRSDGPGDGMERSYEEILRVLDRLGHNRNGLAFRGSTSYLPAGDEPVRSEAVDDLIARGLTDREGPLYVAAVGAITNVASALLLAPRLVERLVVVWLGGQPTSWPTAAEFNLQQDVAAAQVVFNSGVPLVHIPCSNVAEMLRTTVPEMERYVRGRGPIGDYLYEIFLDYGRDKFAWSKVLWDLSAPAWLVNAEWVRTVPVPSPVLTDQQTWSLDRRRHTTLEAIHVDRDGVYGDLFRKLEALL